MGTWLQSLMPALMRAQGAGAVHRYWRAKNFTGTASFYEVAEVQFLQSGVVRTAGIIPTFSAVPAVGSGNNLTNGVLTDRAYWSTATADSLIITFDLGAAYAVNQFGHCRYDAAGRLPTSVTIEWSDDSAAWTAVGTFAMSDAAANFTFATFVSF